MILSLMHLTQYRYPLPAHSSFNELWMRPVTDVRQALIDFTLEVLPEATVHRRQDFFGNDVHFVHIPANHWELSITMRAHVLTSPVGQLPGTAMKVLDHLRPQFFEYLTPTPRVPLDQDWPEILGIMRPEPYYDIGMYLRDLTATLKAMFIYQPFATDVNTPLATFVNTRTGVCQDYAHAMLAVLRSVGIPARYASGYLHTGLPSGGSHAWVEAYIPGAGWTGFDATNGTIITEQHVKVAHGKDYDDCPPLKGMRWGGGRESLFVNVEVTEAQMEEASGLPSFT